MLIQMKDLRYVSMNLSLLLFLWLCLQDISTHGVMWHCVNTKTVIHMHRLLMYDDLMTKYQHVKEELNIQNNKKYNEIDTDDNLTIGS